MLKSINPQPKGAILDMDGVLWRSDEPICDLPRLFELFKQSSIKVVMASNSAFFSVDQFFKKFLTMGVKLEPWQVVSSSMAVISLLKNILPNGGPIYIMGSPSLRDTLSRAGFFHSNDAPRAVVVGMDRELSYQKVDDASRWVRSGLPFFGTNPDPTYPIPSGFAPGAGATIAMVETASGRKAIIAGKPNPYLFEEAIRRLGTKPEETLVIGDRLDTDILGGVRVGCKTVLVLSGVSQRKDLSNWEPKPDLVLNTIMELFSP